MLDRRTISIEVQAWMVCRVHVTPGRRLGGGRSKKQCGEALHPGGWEVSEVMPQGGLTLKGACLALCTPGGIVSSLSKEKERKKRTEES